jgi:hypothetical protein
MANFRGLSGALTGLKLKLEQNLTPIVEAGIDAKVRVLDSTSLDEDGLAGLPTNTLGIYLHRIEVEPIAANRTMPPPRRGLPRQPEIVLNLHIFLIALKAASDGEATLMGWAIQQLANATALDNGLLNSAEPQAQWHPEEELQIFPEPMSTEELLRIWESLPGDYHLCSPYVIRNVRVLPSRLVEQGPRVGEIESRVGERDYAVGQRT